MQSQTWSGRRHPLEFLLPTRGTRMFAVVILTIGTLWLSWIMQRLARGIEPGILALEFAGTPERARSILEAWGASGEARILAQLGINNWWLFFYSTTLALLCVMIAIRVRAHAARWAEVGVTLAWAVWAAAILDRIENFALTRVINGDVRTAFTMTALVCATVKFLVVILCLLYIIGSPFFSRKPS